MNILHTVENYYPSVGGMQEVVKQISERLVEMGHLVTVATSKNIQRKSMLHNGVNIEEFECGGNMATILTGEIEAYQHYLLHEKFDVITNFAAQNFTTDAMLSILTKINAKKVFVPTGFSMLHSNIYKNYYNQMKLWMNQYDMNVFLSNDYRDINFARQNEVNRCMLIPNGADEKEFLTAKKLTIREKINIKNEAFLILHVGSFTGYKGHIETLSMFINSKIPNGYLLFIGNHYNDIKWQPMFFLKWFLLRIKGFFKGKKWSIEFLTRSETVEAFKASNLFLFPSNIECSPIVLFECMAARLPFLVTDVGNSKEIIEWSKGGELLPTLIDINGYSRVQIKKAAKQLTEIATDKSKLYLLANKGFEAWKNNFSWNIIAKKYESMYLSLINN